MKETYYVVQDKRDKAFYCILPGRSFAGWSNELCKAFFFSTEAEAEKVMLGIDAPTQELTVLTVNMTVGNFK